MDAIIASSASLADASLKSKIITLCKEVKFAYYAQDKKTEETLTNAHWMMIGCLFLIGFFLYAPDSQISGVAAVDFGHSSGASSAAGFINGCGSISAIIGGGAVGYIVQYSSWNTLFMIFSGMTFLAALILLPKWHVIPTHQEEK